MSAEEPDSPVLTARFHPDEGEGIQSEVGNEIPDSDAPSGLSSPSIASSSAFYLLATPSQATPPASPAPLPCPQAGLLRSWWRWPSYFTLSWLTPLISLGMKRTIRFSDLWDCFPEEKSEQCWEAFEPHWERAKLRAKQKGGAPHLLGALCRMLGWSFLFSMLVYAWVTSHCTSQLSHSLVQPPPGLQRPDLMSLCGCVGCSGADGSAAGSSVSQ
jgi:hypothetical protein